MHAYSQNKKLVARFLLPHIYFPTQTVKLLHVYVQIQILANMLKAHDIALYNNGIEDRFCINS